MCLTISYDSKQGPQHHLKSLPLPHHHLVDELHPAHELALNYVQSDA